MEGAWAQKLFTCVAALIILPSEYQKVISFSTLGEMHKQSHCIKVVWWALFTKHNLKFGLAGQFKDNYKSRTSAFHCTLWLAFTWEFSLFLAILIMSDNASPLANRTNIVLLWNFSQLTSSRCLRKIVNSCQIFSLYFKKMLTNSLVTKILDSYIWSFILANN